MQNQLFGAVVKDIGVGAGGLGFDSRLSQIKDSVACHCCDISSELCCCCPCAEQLCRHLAKPINSKILKFCVFVFFQSLHQCPSCAQILSLFS